MISPGPMRYEGLLQKLVRRLDLGFLHEGPRQSMAAEEEEHPSGGNNKRGGKEISLGWVTFPELR